MEINALLVRLSIRVFSNTRKDPALTNEVLDKHSLAATAGRWLKVKLPAEPPESTALACLRGPYSNRTNGWEAISHRLPAQLVFSSSRAHWWFACAALNRAFHPRGRDSRSHR